MYLPPAFAESDVGTILDFIDAHPFGTVVTAAPDLYATHLPLVLDRSRGGHGVLQGHVARANPHVERASASGAVDAMVIVTGPDAYVTPEWYAAKREHGRVVPTWNYVAVHAWGTLRWRDDPAYLLPHLQTLTARHETGRERPWSLGDAPDGFIESLMRQIVGFEIEIARLEGKWKMSQNRSAADIDGVVAGLSASSAPGDRAVAAIVEARRPASKR